MKRIKVHFYRVVGPDGGDSIGKIFERLAKLKLENRLQTCGAQQIRLDDVSPHETPDGGTVWLLRFIRFRDDNWPGVSAAAEAAKDLELDADQFLSEETSVIYSSEGNRLAIQYNHFGVRASKVREYINQIVSDPALSYAFTPVLTDEALEKYKSKQIITSVDAVIDGVTDADVALLQGSGLEGALAKSIEAKATTFKFSFSVDARVKANQLESSWISSVIDRIKSRAGDKDSLVVTAKENQEDAVEVIDLLECRKMTEYNADSIDRTLGRRYDPTQLYGLLQQALKEWVKTEN